jgi:hypothetical protein
MFPGQFSRGHCGAQTSMKDILHTTRIKLFLMIGLSLLPAVTCAGSQTTSPSTGALSAELRTHVQNEKFLIVTAIRGLPLGVRDALQGLFGSGTLDIADPGAEFQAAQAAVNSALPTRRLVSAGCSMDHCIVYYERGGPARTWHAALFHWTPAATRLEWGAAAPAGLGAMENVLSAMLSGSIKDEAKSW